MPLAGANRATGPPGELVDDQEADVVPVPGVGRAGVAQPDHQPGPHGTVLAAAQALAGSGCGCSAASAVSSASGSSASVGSMPASASASASSASTCLGARRGGDVDDQGVRIDGQRRPLGQLQVARRGSGCRRAGPRSRPRSAPGCGSPRPRRDGVAGRPRRGCRRPPRPRSAIGMSTVTFSPRRTMTRSTCSMVCFSGSRWTCLGSASWDVAVDVDGQQGVGRPQGQQGLVTGQGDVDRIGAVAVQHGGNLVGAADPAGSTLAELRTQFGGELYLGHERTPRSFCLSCGCRLSEERRRAQIRPCRSRSAATLAQATAQP